MTTPVRAFCPILFHRNGGQFSDKGRPIFAPNEDGDSPRGTCDVASDCGVCPYLAQWLWPLMRQGWLVGWECPSCLSARESTQRWLPGFYQEGRDEQVPPFPLIPEFDNSAPDRPPLNGCTRCGWQSSFLQLVLRKETDE